jgi:hypothetical protein
VPVAAARRQKHGGSSILLGHSSVLVTEARYAFLEGEAVAESLSGRTKIGTGTADVISISKVKQ